MISRDATRLFIVIVIFIAACIETDMFLPALSEIMHHFSVDAEQVQRLLTWNFLGMCIAGPIYGPLSDSWGRRGPLLVALALFAIGSAATFWAPSFDWMLLGRLLQGIGSGGCFTLGTAILFDLFSQKKAVIALAKINSMVPFIIALAPLLGGYLTAVFGFRASFLFILVLVLLSLCICGRYFSEPLPETQRKTWDSQRAVKDLLHVASCTQFWLLVLVVSVLFAGYMTFLSGSAVLFVEALGVSPKRFPVYQAAVLSAWLAASLFYNKVLRTWDEEGLRRLGIACVLTGGLGLGLISSTAPTSPWLLTLPMIIYTFGVNWVQGLFFPEAMELVSDCKGMGASLLTSLRLLITSFLVDWAAWHYNGTIQPITWIVLLATLFTMLCTFLYRPKPVQAIAQP